MRLTAFGGIVTVFAILIGSTAPAAAARAESTAVDSAGSAAVDYEPWHSAKAEALGLRRCLGVSGGNMNNGTRIVLYDCDGSANQQWRAVPRNGLFQEISNGANPFKCLAVSGGSVTRGVSLVIWDCVSSADQRWAVSPAGGGYVLENLKSGMYVSLLHGGVANGTSVVQWPAPPFNVDQFWIN